MLELVCLGGILGLFVLDFTVREHRQIEEVLIVAVGWFLLAVKIDKETIEWRLRIVSVPRCKFGFTC